MCKESNEQVNDRTASPSHVLVIFISQNRADAGGFSIVTVIIRKQRRQEVQDYHSQENHAKHDCCNINTLLSCRVQILIPSLSLEINLILFCKLSSHLAEYKPENEGADVIGKEDNVDKEHKSN